MPDVSFGPIFVIASLLMPSRDIYNLNILFNRVFQTCPTQCQLAAQLEPQLSPQF